MESLLIAAFVLATVALATVFVLIPIAGYVIWRYVISPWTVMRRDIVALHERLTGVERQAQVRTMNDADVARAEARLNARQRARIDREAMQP